jgi:hypothetical protein
MASTAQGSFKGNIQHSRVHTELDSAILGCQTTREKNFGSGMHVIEDLYGRFEARDLILVNRVRLSCPRTGRVRHSGKCWHEAPVAVSQ